VDIIDADIGKVNRIRGSPHAHHEHALYGSRAGFHSSDSNGRNERHLLRGKTGEADPLYIQGIPARATQHRLFAQVDFSAR
jgi:hypothetical protein